MHGFYGLSWIPKDYSFGDKSWLQPVTPVSAISDYAFLMVNHGSACIIGGYNLIKYGCMPVPRLQRTISIFMFLFGYFLMMSSDVQKNVTIGIASQHPQTKGLIKTGLYSYTRNPNFLGELMIYYGMHFPSG